MAKSLSKELKQPDEFVSFWTRFGAKVSENRTKVLATLATAALVGAGAWGVTTYRNAKAAKATVAFERIDRIANAGLLPEKATEKDAKEAAEDEDKSVPRFKTDKERLEAAIQEADRFLAEFGSAKLGRKAMLGKAGRLLVLGKPAEAATIYESLAASESDPDLKVLQQEGLAAANESAGKLDEAVRIYSGIADEAQRLGNFYLDRALFAKARLLEKQGKGKDAERTLREILEKVPRTFLRPQIDDRLAILAEN